jgi:predicted ATP-grasp superfamily ATP-dependent carboligase
MSDKPYADAELEAGARAALLEVYAPDATDEEIAAVVLSAVAPLIATRVRAEALEEAAEAILNGHGHVHVACAQELAWRVRELATTTTPEGKAER